MNLPSLDAIGEIAGEAHNAFYIGGEWVAPAGGRRVELVSPVDERVWTSAPLADAVDVGRAAAAARAAFDSGVWSNLPASERAAMLRRFAGEIERREPLFARLWTAQVGAPISFAGMFVPTARAMLGYYADLIETYEFEDRRQTFGGEARVLREPVGPAALITPWNAALPILFYKLAAALAAGCTTVIKSSPETPFDGLLVAECAHAAGIPAGVVNVITADREAGAQLVASPLLDKVSFTGSTRAGKAVGVACLDRMARFTLELGGKSAAIFLDDADLSQTLPAIAPYTMPFSGQICFAQTRIIAPRSRVDELLAAYAGAMSGVILGDPWLPETQLGPVSSAAQMERTLDHIARAKADGARLVIGGGRAAGVERGYFIAPTIFADATPDMAIVREEVFGPVVVVQPYDSEEEAIALANGSDFGLSGSIMTSDPERGYRVARRIRTGNISINSLQMAPNVPFGGYKQSGIGREGGPEGLAAFLETKAIYMPADGQQ
ncbi:MAG: Aldehyde Dehydrogenase [Bradyrhizobium sp.]|nr:Aldehyde Dehydrogenase [Bradyrhizobium sp.]